MTVSKFKRGQNIRVATVAYKSEMSSLKNNSFLSHRSVPKLATVRGFMKTPVYKRIVGKILHCFFIRKIIKIII